MKRCLLMVLLPAMPLASFGYQYIVSGEANTNSVPASSVAAGCSAFSTGAVPETPASPSAIDARFRTWWASLGAGFEYLKLVRGLIFFVK